MNGGPFPLGGCDPCRRDGPVAEGARGLEQRLSQTEGPSATLSDSPAGLFIRLGQEAPSR